MTTTDTTTDIYPIEVPTLASVLAAGEDPREQLERWGNLQDGIETLLMRDTDDIEHQIELYTWVGDQAAVGEDPIPSAKGRPPMAYEDRVDWVKFNRWEVEVLSGEVTFDELLPYLNPSVQALATNPMFGQLRRAFFQMDEALEQAGEGMAAAKNARAAVLAMLDQLVPGEAARWADPEKD